MAHLSEPIDGTLELRNFVGGEWVKSRSSEIVETINPATYQTIAEVAMSTPEEVSEAVNTAASAFAEWKLSTPLSRARLLSTLCELMEENFEELSRVQTMEHGKTIDESRGETRRGIENVEVTRGMPSLMMGQHLENVAAGIDEFSIQQPLGPFCCIPPFNFPFMVPLWFVPYALATGNTFIVKPSPSDPISQVKLCELIDEAGFPPGVFNLIHGGAEVATALMENPNIKGVTFVGSTPIARIVYESCGKSGKRVIAQGGAKNFILIMPDADIRRTIAALMTSFYGNTGQRCLSGANAVVVGEDAGFYTEFVKEFVDAASRIRIGYGLDESIQMGPLQSADKKERVLGYIEAGVAEGAKLTLDGREFEIEGDYPDTCFLGASVFEDVKLSMRVAKEEIFGPVACFLRAKDLDEGLEMIHGSPFGNAASIFTASGRDAREFQTRVSCGNVGINIGVAAPMAFFPFSGMKDSFFGTLHGQGRDAVRFFTESKIVIQRWF